MKNTTLALAFAGISILYSCVGDTKKPLEKQATIAVTINQDNRQNSDSFITASGMTEAENSANISTRIMGYITAMHVTVGQQVKAGQLLVSIGNSDLQAKKAQAEANVLQANAAYNNAKKDYARFVKLFEQQSASQKELDDMTSRFEMAKAALEGAKQMRNEVLAQFSYSNITAPFSGTITNTFSKEGDMANPGMPLLSIEGASRLQVSTIVSDKDINAIQPGMQVQVFVKSIEKEQSGKVTEVSTSAKNTGGQYAVKIILEKADPSLRAGMYVNVKFPVKSEAVAKGPGKLLVPETALVNQGQLTGIYTIGNGDKAILRWLKTGGQYGNSIEILSGLSPDEKYIVSAEGKLYNGAPVTIK